MNEDKLFELKSAMEAENNIREEIAELREQFETEHAPLFLQQREIQEQINGCKEILTENAESGYAKDGEKKRLGGIGIRVMTNLEYSEEAAFTWAKEHSLCLKLDASAFKKIAKTQDIGFVKKSDKVCVTFPSEIKLEEKK